MTLIPATEEQPGAIVVSAAQSGEAGRIWVFDAIDLW
jgi:hypothetical protein